MSDFLYSLMLVHVSRRERERRIAPVLAATCSMPLLGHMQFVRI